MHAAARVGREKAEAGGVGAKEAMARLAAEFQLGAARFREGSGKVQGRHTGRIGREGAAVRRGQGDDENLTRI